MLRALLLEDSPRDVELIRELLIDAGFDLEMDFTALEKEFISLLRSRTYDIILSDFNLPGFDAFAALRWSLEICPNVPFICVSGTIGEHTAVELLKQGAVDYVLKDKLIKLPSAIHRALGEVKEKETRREAEAALQESKERYNALFERSLDLVYICDFEGYFIDANDATLNLLGYKKEEIRSLTFASLLSEEQLPLAFKVAQEIRETGGQKGLVEFRLRSKNGEEVRVESIGSAIMSNGITVAIQAIARDISERKRAEEKLTRSEEKYRSIFENVQDVYFEVSIDGTILEVSPSIEIMSNGQYHREDLVGKPMDDFYSVAGGRRALLALLRERNSITDREIALKNRDGSSVACSISAKILFDAQGVPLKIVGSMLDISERKRAEKALSQSEERFKLLYEYAPIGMLLANRSGQILEVNPAAIRILASPSVEETKKINLLTFPLLIKSGISAALKSCIETGQASFGEYLYTSKWEKTIYTHLRYVPICDDHHQVTLVHVIIEDVTERKRTEEALRLSEERYRHLFDASPDGIVVIGPDGCIMRANIAQARMYQYDSPDDLIGVHATQLVAMSSRDYSAEILKRRLNGEYIPPVEYELARKDGTTFYGETSATSLRKADGTVSGYICVTRDISERKQAEDALTYERNLLNALMDNMPDHIYFKDRESRFLKISKSQAHQFGLDDSGQAVGKTDFDFFAEEHARPAFEDEQKILKSGIAIVGLEEKESWPDGREGWVSTTKVPLRNEQGEIVGTFGISRDITKSKQAEEERHRLMTAIEQTLEAILVTDPSGIIQYVNPAFERITGFTRKEAIGQNPRILNSGHQSAGFYEDLWKTISTGGKWTGRFVNKKKNGTLFTDETSISPVVDEKREIINYVGVKRDITSELSLQTQLTQAQKLEGIGTLASGIAHDFNNILGIIMGHTSLLDRLREDPNMYAESVAAIMKATQRG